jgi:hypothetical protein
MHTQTHIHTHTYIHTYIHTHTHTCIHIHTYINTYTNTYIHTYQVEQLAIAKALEKMKDLHQLQGNQRFLAIHTDSRISLFFYCSVRTMIQLQLPLHYYVNSPRSLSSVIFSSSFSLRLGSPLCIFTALSLRSSYTMSLMFA